MKEMLVNELERFFRPEFINRLDEVVVFHKLTHADLINILDLEVEKVNKRLKDHGLALQLTDEAKEFVLEKGTDEKFGARPLRRTISSMIEDPLSEDILRNRYQGKSLIRLSVKTGEKGDKELLFEGLDAKAESPDLALASAETT
jgi:ATP-dependent Clp protease ATP-binding subunit ClpC